MEDIITTSADDGMNKIVLKSRENNKNVLLSLKLQIEVYPGNGKMLKEYSKTLERYYILLVCAEVIKEMIKPSPHRGERYILELGQKRKQMLKCYYIYGMYQCQKIVLGCIRRIHALERVWVCTAK